MTIAAQTLGVPSGTYICRYLGDRAVEPCVAADFVISVGPNKGERVHMLICSRKAVKAIQQRSAGWLEWLAYEGDAAASRVLDSTLNSVAGYFFADVEDGRVKRVFSPTRSEATFNRFLEGLSELWSLRVGADAVHGNLEACKSYLRIMGLLPRPWGTSPGERELRQWLDHASDSSSDLYVHDAAVWLNKIYTDLGGVYERVGARSWPLILKNNGFDRAPKRPKGAQDET